MNNTPEAGEHASKSGLQACTVEEHCRRYLLHLAAFSMSASAWTDRAERAAALRILREDLPRTVARLEAAW